MCCGMCKHGYEDSRGECKFSKRSWNDYPCSAGETTHMIAWSVDYGTEDEIKELIAEQRADARSYEASHE